MTDNEQLVWAIARWAEAAESKPEVPAYRDMCLRTVKALELELQTGRPHCACCLSPDTWHR